MSDAEYLIEQELKELFRMHGIPEPSPVPLALVANGLVDLVEHMAKDRAEELADNERANRQPPISAEALDRAKAAVDELGSFSRRASERLEELTEFTHA
jgi:hypothetical protein